MSLQSYFGSSTNVNVAERPERAIASMCRLSRRATPAVKNCGDSSLTGNLG